MTKQAISPDQFQEEMNKELQLSPNYRPGMQVVPVPSGTRGWGMSGYDLEWAGNDLDVTTKAALLNRIFHIVNAKFVVV